MTETNKLNLKIDVPTSWAEGQTLSWPINTGLKSRAFVFVRVTPPGEDQNEFTPCDVTHLGNGFYEASFTPVCTGVHKILIEVEGGLFEKEYTCDIIQGKKIGKPKIVGYNFKSMCPGEESVCHLYFPDEIKTTDFFATITNKASYKKKIPIVPYKGNYAILYTPTKDDDKIVITVQNSLTKDGRNQHIEGSPIIVTVGPPNPWTAVSVKIPANDVTKKEQYCFHITTPAHTEVNDFIIDANVVYFNLNRNLKQKASQKLICHVAQSEIQKDITVYNPDEDMLVEPKDGRLSPRGTKSKSKNVIEADISNKPPTRPSSTPIGDAPQRPSSTPTGKPAGSKMLPKGLQTETPQSQPVVEEDIGVSARPVNNNKRPVIFNTMAANSLFSDPNAEATDANKPPVSRPTTNAPVNTFLPKMSLANIDPSTYVPYVGPVKRWDCYFVAEQDGEVLINIYLHNHPVVGGPWKFQVNGESHPFTNGLSWDTFAAEHHFPRERKDHENGFVVNCRWQNLTEKATLLSFTACSILSDGKIDETVLEGQKISPSGTLEIIPIGKMAGRSARKLIIRPKALKAGVACVPIFVTCLTGGFTNVASLSINTTLVSPDTTMLPSFGKAPPSDNKTDGAFFVGIMYKNHEGVWGLHPVGKYVAGSLITKLMTPFLDIVHQYTPLYVTPPSLVLRRAPVPSNITQMEVTRTGIWDTSLHKNTKQALIGNTVSFAWTNEVHQVVKDGEDFGGVKNNGETLIVNLTELSPDVKCVLFIVTVKNPIWDAKPMKILSNANVSLSGLLATGEKLPWANYSIKGGEKMAECSSIVEGKLFRNSYLEPWEYLSISKGCEETEVVDFLGDFTGYKEEKDEKADDKDKKKKDKKEKSVPTINKHNIVPYLATDWSQKVRHLRVIVLECKNIVPLKNGITSSSLCVEITNESDSKERDSYKGLPKTGVMTEFKKFQKDQSAFWGSEFEMKDVLGYNEVPVKVSLFESADEIVKNAKPIGSCKLDLARMFGASIGEGGTVIEQWCKLTPSTEETSAIKSHGMWWGVTAPEISLKLRFISFS